MTPKTEFELARRVVEETVAEAEAHGLRAEVKEKSKASLRRLTRFLEPDHSLFIGIFGSTASGKTTLANALAGWQVLPTDAGELSAGVVVVNHRAGAFDLKVVGDPDTPWNPGYFRCESVDELNHRICSILYLYQHLARKGERAPTPLLEVELDLSAVRSLLAVGADLSLAIVDLPGLRVLDDKVNGPIIQHLAHSCLPIVAMDYSQMFAEEQLESILGLLRDRNRFVRSGNPPVLLLNKADRVTSQDGPMDEKNVEAQTFCSKVLGCDCESIPVSALLLQHSFALAQELGMAAFSFSPENKDALSRLSTIARELLQDGRQALKAQLPASRDASRRLNDIADALEDGAAPGLEQFHWLSSLAFQAGGGQSLRTALSRSAERARATLGTPPLELLIDQCCSVASSEEPNKARGEIVAHLLQLVIEADQRVHPSEPFLARKLLEDYQRKFCCRSPRACDDSISNDVTGVSVERVLSELRHRPFPREQARWVLNALRAVMTVDRHVDEREEKLLQHLEPFIRGTR